MAQDTSVPGWDDYFLGIAEAVSRRAQCTRRSVGDLAISEVRPVAIDRHPGQVVAVAGDHLLEVPPVVGWQWFGLDAPAYERRIRQHCGKRFHLAAHVLRSFR